MSWGRQLLVHTDTDAMFVSHRGDAFQSEGSFSAYLPRVLFAMNLGHLSFTMLRRIAITGAPPRQDPLGRRSSRCGARRVLGVGLTGAD
jgi:hypothetical protein